MKLTDRQLTKNPRYSAEQRTAYRNGIKIMDERQNVPLEKLQFAVDSNGDGRISEDEWIQDTAEVSANWSSESAGALYLGEQPGFFGKLTGKTPDFHKADGWIEVPDSGPVRYETKVLKSIDQQNQTAEIATVLSIPFLREPLYV